MDLVSGEHGAVSTVNKVVKPLDFLKEVIQVVEWLDKVDERGKTDCGSQSHSSLAVRLEAKFNEANGRITELEGQLSEAHGENGSLNEKLNEMELLAGRYHVELIRLKRELEIEKWKRFDTESRFKKMVKDVAELHASVRELVNNLQEDEQKNKATVPALMAPQSNQLVIKRELVEEEEERLLRDDVWKKREDLQTIFLDLSSQVQDRLQKCEDMQVGTKVELNGIMQELASIHNLISQKKITRNTITINSKSQDGKNGVTSVIPSCQTRVSKTLAPQKSALTIQPETKIPGPIKSILMKRSADGTFKRRRNSLEQEEPSSAVKRKRVQFCLDDSSSVIVHAEHQENQIAQKLVDAVKPDPLEVNHDNHGQVNHFEVMKKGEFDKLHCNCGRSFGYKKLLNRHLSMKLNGKIFNCHMCSKTFVLHESLKKHVRKAHRVEYHGGRFGCRVCGETFTVYRQLRQHQITHRHKKQMLSQGITQR